MSNHKSKYLRSKRLRAQNKERNELRVPIEWKIMRFFELPSKKSEMGSNNRKNVRSIREARVCLSRCWTMNDSIFYTIIRDLNTSQCFKSVCKDRCMNNIGRIFKRQEYLGCWRCKFQKKNDAKSYKSLQISISYEIFLANLSSLIIE